MNNPNDTEESIVALLNVRQLFLFSLLSPQWLWAVHDFFPQNWQLNGNQEIREFVHYSYTHIGRGYRRVINLSINVGPPAVDFLPTNLMIDMFHALPALEELIITGSGSQLFMANFARLFDRMNLYPLKRIIAPVCRNKVINMNYLLAVSQACNRISELEFCLTKRSLNGRPVYRNLGGFIGGFPSLERLIIHPSITIPLTLEDIIRHCRQLVELDINPFSNGQPENQMEVIVDGQEVETQLSVLRIPTHCCIPQMFTALVLLNDLTLYGSHGIGELLLNLNNPISSVTHLCYHKFDALDERLFTSLARVFPSLMYIDIFGCDFTGLITRDSNVDISFGMSIHLNISIDISTILEQGEYQQIVVVFRNINTQRDCTFIREDLFNNKSTFVYEAQLEDEERELRRLVRRRRRDIITINVSVLSMSKLRLYDSQRGFSQKIIY